MKNKIIKIEFRNAVLWITRPVAVPDTPEYHDSISQITDEAVEMAEKFFAIDPRTWLSTTVHGDPADPMLMPSPKEPFRFLAYTFNR